jgi:hypothetical protein
VAIPDRRIVQVGLVVEVSLRTMLSLTLTLSLREKGLEKGYSRVSKARVA